LIIINPNFKKRVIVFEWREHIIYGVFVAWIISVLLNFNIFERIIYFLLVPFGAILPDIDMPTTKMGRKVKLLSKFINKKVGHRTLTHSLFFITVVYYSNIIAFGINIVSTAIMIGCVTHIFFDLMTPMGEPLAYPFSDKCYHLDEEYLDKYYSLYEDLKLDKK
jgi:inner membrane protein